MFREQIIQSFLAFTTNLSPNDVENKSVLRQAKTWRTKQQAAYSSDDMYVTEQLRKHLTFTQLF